jgi:hypothetical protein
MREIEKGAIAIFVFVVVSLSIPVVELNRVPDYSPPTETITGGWSDPILIFVFGAYSAISHFSIGYGIDEGITNASSLPFLWLIIIDILLLILLMTRKTSVKVTFPVSLMVLFAWVWLSVQAYAALEDWGVRPVLITPLVGSILTLVFINDIESLRKSFRLKA